MSTLRAIFGVVLYRFAKTGDGRRTDFPPRTCGCDEAGVTKLRHEAARYVSAAAPRAGSRTRVRSRPTRAHARPPAGRRTAGFPRRRTRLRARRRDGCRGRCVPSKRKQTNCSGAHRRRAMRERHQERPRVERKEQLPAVGMIVAVPQQHALRRASVRFVGTRRLAGVRQDVMAADGFVAAVQDVAAPFADEHAGVVPPSSPESSSTERHPAPASARFRSCTLRIVDQKSVTGERVVGRVDDRHAHAPQPVGQRGVEVVNGHAFG